MKRVVHASHHQQLRRCFAMSANWKRNPVPRNLLGYTGVSVSYRISWEAPLLPKPNDSFDCSAQRVMVLDLFLSSARFEEERWVDKGVIVG